MIMSDRKELLGEVDRIVVKMGTSSIMRKGDALYESLMDAVAAQTAELKKNGKEVLLVTSGAIGVGMKAMGVHPNPNEIPMRQAAASVGQGILMQKWNESFQKQGLNTAQILITKDDYSRRNTVLNLNNTVDALLRNGVVPIFNENDAICIKEIGEVFGDNDTLSAVIASRTDADLLLILSDVGGLYNRDPGRYPDAELVKTVSRVTADIENMAGNSVSGLGVGGMKTKVAAARICGEAGCSMIIASASESCVITRIAVGEDIGTLFISNTAVPKKRRWLKAVVSHGRVTVDDGAKKAVYGNSSLLPVGVKYVEGTFSAGEVVEIFNRGEVIAKGISDYNSDELMKIRGLRSDMAEKVIGHRNHTDAVRRENMVILNTADDIS